MNKLITLTALTLFSICALKAQIKPVERDTTESEMADSTVHIEYEIDEYETVEETPADYEMMDRYDYDYAEATVEAPEYELFFNKFQNNNKLKAVEKTDKKAVYSLGLFEMMSFIANNISTPHTYGNNAKSEFVLIRCIVGKDSLLYNPEILSTPGSNYTFNAKNILERLPARFIPATVKGKAVDSYIIIPIRFEYSLYRNRYDHYPAH